MNCMKCGRGIPEAQVFCPECLAEMERYPVKPGTPIQLLSRPVQSPQKTSYRKKEVPPEKKLRRQRRAIWFLSVLLTASLGLAAFFGILLWEQHHAEAPDETIGQNYSAVETGNP